MSTQTLASIGMPVHNGEAFLRTTLDSLLSQTLTDFELIISDNASSDQTEKICRGVESCDARVRYFRQPRNIGAPANWNFVARQARGRFFKWASASDICAPRFLEACIAPMLTDDSIVLCFGKTSYVDEAGDAVAIRENPVEALEPRPSERFRRVCENLSLNSEQYGVMRRDALMKTRLDRLYPHGDLVLMAELAMLGRFKLVPETLLTRRAARGHWTGMMSSEELDVLFWPGPRPKVPVVFVRRHLDYLWTALTSPVAWSERLRAADFALRFAYWRKRLITLDVINAVRRRRILKA